MWFHLKPFDLNPFNIELWGGIVYDPFEEKETVEERQSDWSIKKIEKDKDFIDLNPF